LVEAGAAERVALRGVLAALLRRGYPLREHLEALLESQAPARRRAGAWACAVIGDQARLALADVLDDPDPDVRVAAIVGLCRFRDAHRHWPTIASAVAELPAQPLASMRDADPDVRRVGFLALPHLGVTPSTVLATALEMVEDPAVADALPAMLASLAPEQLREHADLCILGLRRPQARGVAALALGTLGRPAGPEAADALVAALAQPDVPLGSEAAEARWYEAVDAGASPPPPGTQGALLWALCRVGSPAQVTAALVPLAGGGPPALRRAAVEGLYAAGPAEAIQRHAVPAVVALIEDGHTPEPLALLGLLRSRPLLATAARPALQRIAEDPARSHAVRMQARATLRAITDPSDPKGPPPAAPGG
jgi:HEAT repeat protein